MYRKFYARIITISLNEESHYIQLKVPIMQQQSSEFSLTEFRY